MAKLSVIIPSRDERFLIPTIDDIFKNATQEIEVVAVLDSDKWPDKWDEVVKRHQPRLHTIHNGSPIGMRGSINRGVGSAISRGATYIAKSDGHCAFSEGFDEVLKAEMDNDWIVVPRRLRLDAENWTIAEPEKPPHDYHYLSFPDDPNDFGGAGLNGKPWIERTKERLNKPEYDLDEELSSQGSFWAMKAAYFERMGFMDEASYGPFWNEFQELGLCCWLSGGKVMVNKKCHYLHLHKGKVYGRGYKLDEKWLKQGRNHTMLWPWNEAWDKQVVPFSWLIEHFWPVPGWPDNWQEILYAGRAPRQISITLKDVSVIDPATTGGAKADDYVVPSGLQIHSAWYGVDVDSKIDVTARVRTLVQNGLLDIRVDNSTLAPDQNPFRGKRKALSVVYSIDGGERVLVQRAEKEILIIGKRSNNLISPVEALSRLGDAIEDLPPEIVSGIIREGEQDRLQRIRKARSESPKPVQVVAEGKVCDITVGPADVEKVHLDEKRADFKQLPLTAAALNDYLIRKFSISSYRLRAPMPIELPNFHRNDLAKLFAELGFTVGAEIGVAEGRYSEQLCQSIPNLEKLYCVDPWHRYSENPQGHSKEHHEFALNETKRRLAGYIADSVVELVQEYSMDAVRKIEESSLDFVNIDAHHSFDFVTQDLIEWSKRVRSGGIVLLDDYYYIDRKRWGAGVVEAVQAYTSAHEITPWFVCEGYRSTDCFWVRP